MQKLHLVGFTTDHRALILSVRRGARSGRYVLELDDKVTESVSEAIARRAAGLDDAAGESLAPPAPPRPESALSVRELQARLRAGRSVEEVAAEAGVEAEWVERFAPPVVAEQARVVEATRAAYFERSRLGSSGVPLGVAVYRNLVERGVRLTAEELDAGWTARQGADGRWLVTLTYSSRGREQQPTWELEGPRGPVRADDRLAADLAYIAPESPPPAPKPVLAPKAATAAPPTDGDREAARRVAVARREAEARLDEAARAASRRNAERARRGTVAEEPPEAPPVAKAAAVRRPAKASTPTRATRDAAKPKVKAMPKPKAEPAAATPTRAARPKSTTTAAAAKTRKQAAPAAKGKNRHAKATASKTQSKAKAKTKTPAHARQPAKPSRRRAPVLRTDLADPGRPNGSAAAPSSPSRAGRPERLRAR